MNNYMETNQYEDIINLPHHQSVTRPHMSIHDRAAQFSPFAALTGYDEEVTETARLTDRKLELTEEKKTELDMKLSAIKDKVKSKPEIVLTYFIPDERKSGGKYVTVLVSVKKVDTYARTIVLSDNSVINIDDIADIIYHIA